MREFVVLSKYLNFSLAAKQLHMTQPGLSRHISILENDIGIKLFQRDTHRVKLTQNGEQFLNGIQKIINDYESLCAAVAKDDFETITIGVPYYGVNTYLSRFIGRFESDHDRVEIKYMPAYPDEIITGLLSMRVDVAVLPRVNFISFKKLIFHDTVTESLVLMLNRNHALAKKSAVKIGDLKNEDFISLKGNWGNALFEKLCDYCRQKGFDPPQKRKETDTIEEAALNMKPDAGVMLLPGHFKDANISGNIKCIHILDRDCHLPISLVHHPENPNQMINKFIRFYLNQVKQDNAEAQT